MLQNLDFPKIKKLKKVYSQKCENNVIFKQNYSLKLFISFKKTYSFCFGLRFSRFPPKKVLQHYRYSE